MDDTLKEKSAINSKETLKEAFENFYNMTEEEKDEMYGLDEEEEDDDLLEDEEASEWLEEEDEDEEDEDEWWKEDEEEE